MWNPTVGDCCGWDLFTGVLGGKNGASIDAHDAVFRVNPLSAELSTQVAKVGRRTTVAVMGREAVDAMLQARALDSFDHSYQAASRRAIKGIQIGLYKSLQCATDIYFERTYDHCQTFIVCLECVHELTVSCVLCNACVLVFVAVSSRARAAFRTLTPQTRRTSCSGITTQHSTLSTCSKRHSAA
jgi:hypothetical protein